MFVEKVNFKTCLRCSEIVCEHHFCDSCNIGDRIKKENISLNLPLFTYRDCLKDTLKQNGGNWYLKYIVLSPEVLEKNNIKVCLYNQIAFAYDGCGCFSKNPAGPVDCFLLSNSSIKLTIGRFESFGIPTKRSAEKYDSYFYAGLANKLKGVYNL